MKNVTMVVIALLALSGCSKKGGGESAGTALTKMTEFKNAMCACKDAACAEIMKKGDTAAEQDPMKKERDETAGEKVKKDWTVKKEGDNGQTKK